MSATTSIEWTDRTWNPTTGCDKVSPGCAHCYAEGVAERFWHKQYQPVVETFADGSGRLERPRVFTDVMTHEDRLIEPLSWRKPSKVFVNSMSDLFHEDVPFEFVAAVFGVMAVTSRHTYQILTKRPERMRLFFEWLAVQDPDPWTHCHWEALRRDETERLHRTEGPTERPWPLPNVWLGVSVENQPFADQRIPLVLQTPAAVRFISAEPLLGSVNLGPFLQYEPFHDDYKMTFGEREWRGLDWVIVGGESGKGARPFDLAWARSIVQQCQAAGVPVFVKQVGSRPDGWWTNKLGPRFNRHALKDRKGGDMAEWPDDLRIREFPTVEARRRHPNTVRT